MTSLFVQAGQKLTAELWNAFWRERRGCHLRSGPGVLLKQTGDGTVISFRAASQAFTPSFRVNISGDVGTFGLGFVNGQVPEIEGVPITGAQDKPAPTLPLSDKAEFFDASGRSWLLLRVKVDSVTGRMLQPDEKGEGKLELTIVQKNSYRPTDPKEDVIGYHPIAILRRPTAAKSGLGKLHQIAMFDYQHRTARQIAMFDYQHRTARQNGKWRHFFDPA